MFDTYSIYMSTVGDVVIPLVVGELNGETWVRVFHHRNNNGNKLFSSKDDAKLKNKDNPEDDLYSILQYINNFIGNDGKYEIILTYPGQLDLRGQYNHWKQTTSPMVSNMSGYSPIHIDWTGNSWGGLALSTENNCLIDGSPGVSSWWYAIGSYTRYNNGVPGPNNIVITTGDIDVWIKYNSPDFKIKYKTKYLYQIDNTLYNEVDGELSELNVNEISEEVMLTYGNDTYNQSILASNDNIRLYVYSQNPAITGYRFNYTSLWKGQTIVQDYDFNAEHSKSLKFTATINDNDIFKVLLSNDSGLHWYSLDSDNQVLEVSLDDIKDTGLTLTQINTMSTEKLNEIIGESVTLRFAFYMEQAKSNVHMNVDHVRFEYKV